jgi:hypothetical protein
VFWKKKIVRVPDQDFYYYTVPVRIDIVLIWSPENYSPSSALPDKICNNFFYLYQKLENHCVLKHMPLLIRIPQTKELSMVGLEFGLQVSPLTTCNCPMLQVFFILTPACGLFLYCESGSGSSFFSVRFDPNARIS